VPPGPDDQSLEHGRFCSVVETNRTGYHHISSEAERAIS
jgi:hypothetical protein